MLTDSTGGGQGELAEPWPGRGLWEGPGQRQECGSGRQGLQVTTAANSTGPGRGSGGQSSGWQGFLEAEPGELGL